MGKLNYNTKIGEMYEACPFVKHKDIDYEEGEILCNRCDFNSICAMLPEGWEIDMAPDKKYSEKVVINIYGNVNISNESEVKESEYGE